MKASNGYEAVEKVKNSLQSNINSRESSQDSEQSVDTCFEGLSQFNAIVLDLEMPIMGGLMACKKIIEIYN